MATLKEKFCFVRSDILQTFGYKFSNQKSSFIKVLRDITFLCKCVVEIDAEKNSGQLKNETSYLRMKSLISQERNLKGLKDFNIHLGEIFFHTQYGVKLS